MYIFSHIFNRPFYRQCPEFIKCGQFRSEVFCVFPHAIRGAIDKNFDAPGHLQGFQGNRRCHGVVMVFLRSMATANPQNRRDNWRLAKIYCFWGVFGHFFVNLADFGRFFAFLASFWRFFGQNRGIMRLVAPAPTNG